MNHYLIRIPAKWAWTGLATLTVMVNILVLLIPHTTVPKAVLALLWMFLMPGWLVSRIIRLRTTNVWESLGFSIGFSLLTVLLSALLMNALLPLVGNVQPLGTNSLVLGFDAVWLALMAIAWRRNQGTPLELRPNRPRLRESIYSLAGLPIVALSIMGAVSLNNGGTNAFTYIMLILSAIYLVGLLRWRNQLRESTILIGIYSVGLALLLMTSLRGWYITGHDVQREFQVFIAT
ncbi:MAG TPA: hypothetical protein VHQ86_06500, partial [Candidatus Saccharimonadia bacterium]|nr:hypothetical protein [Candidatus Saccharimonadia bacterium]